MIVKIQNRRGGYSDYDPSKLLPGEFAVVQVDDPNTPDGKAVYIAITAGNVVRLATADELKSDIETALQDAIPKFVDEATQKAEEAADRAEDAASQLNIDASLTIVGRAADAKRVGDEISTLKDNIIQTAGTIEEMECGLTDEVKAALLACFTRVAWIGNDGQTYYNALSEALNRSRVISSINAVFSQGSAVIYDTDEIYALKQYLTVTVTYSDGTTKEVNNYTLSGKLVTGTSTITVAYNKKTTTFNVTVTHQEKTLESISVIFSSSARITTDNVLDDLRPYLTVRAIYSDGSTNTITNYTLSGSLNVGTNTITVTYNNKTATFTVDVTQAEKTLQSIAAVFNQGSAVIYTDSSLNDLKPYLTVTARYSDSTTQTVTNYTLSGTLKKGTSTITASYDGKTATFNVTVSERSATLQSITAAFNQGSAVIYTDSSLNDLKPYLTVTAKYSDGTSQTVTNYTLSGTLKTGTSTITASYSGKTATFTVENVVDYYNIWNWSMANGDFSVRPGTIDYYSNETKVRYTFRTPWDTRRGVTAPKGLLPYRVWGTDADMTPYYPIPIPEDANKVTISITPNTQYIYTQVMHVSDGNVTRITSKGWTQGTTEVTFDKGENNVVFFNTKYDSEGSTYPTDPTEITVTFEEV